MVDLAASRLEALAAFQARKGTRALNEPLVLHAEVLSTGAISQNSCDSCIRPAGSSEFVGNRITGASMPRLLLPRHTARLLKTLLPIFGLVMAGCGSYAGDLAPVKPVAAVDLPRFMGKWYVIASIPTHFEKSAYNAVETYTLQQDGNVNTIFRFRDGAFETPVKTIHSTGYVKDDTGNAVWGVQVFWPVKAQYIVAYLKDDYSQTIVARDARITSGSWRARRLYRREITMRLCRG